MNQQELTDPVANDSDAEPLMGLATLMKMAYSGIDIAPLGVEMVERITANPRDANALMDLATIMQLDFSPELAADFQDQALRIRQVYHLNNNGSADGVRLLAVMTPGNLMANAPLEFLLEGSDVSLDMVYVSTDLPLPASLPEHDLLFVAINECDEVRPLLEQLDVWLKDWPRPVLNAPGQIALLARDISCSLFESMPGVVMPASVRVDKQVLQRVGKEALAITAILENGAFPIIVRPVGSHAGQGLAKLDDRSAIADYLQARNEDEFYVSRFIDYSGADGMFRKYRVVLIDGRAYASHMAISQYWMIHYLNAGMSHSPEKRAEEARFMTDFDEDFAIRHQDAFRAITSRIKLDYLVIDCAETWEGELLVFEIDSGAVVHAMDSAEIFPYKHAQMRKVFGAFRAMLLNTIERGSSRK
jgi:hypothetical protein